MRILFQSDHVLGHNMHGISRMMRRVLKGLEKLGHECVGFDGEFTGGLTGDILLLPANGLVGVPDKQHELMLSCDAPIVSIIYDIIPYVFNEKKEERYVKALRDTLACSRNIITISHHSAKDIRAHLSYTGDITVIHPGVPFDPPNNQTSIAAGPSDYFLSVGGYGERKGHTELLEAILETENQLIMVGVPFYYDQRTKNLAREAISRGLLIEQSGVPDDVLINGYQYAQALVYPTRYEGFGLPIIEAMSCGCPVITTHMTATQEAAGNAAFYIEPTTKDIVWSMGEVSKLRPSLISRGFEQIKKFDWNDIAMEYEQALGMVRIFGYVVP